MPEKIKRIMGIVLLALCLSIIPGYEAEASGIKNINAFNDLDGDGKYLGERYRDNYYLDIEETGLLESTWEIMNTIANIMFSIYRIFAYLVVSVFYYAMDFDIGILFADGLNRIQETMRNSIFEPLFALAFAGTSCIIIARMLKRNMVGIMTEFLKVFLILFLSFLVVNNSDLALSECTNLTKGISIEALTGINNDMGIGNNFKDYSANAAGVLWANLIHEPWKSLEFGTSDVSSSDVNKFLTTEASDTDKRKELVENYPDSKTVFSKRKGIERIGFMSVYFIPFTIKCLVYLLIAILQLLFQVLAVFYLILAPIVLLLALIPGYDLEIISIWVKKMIETQLSILIITFIMGLLIKFDSILYGQMKHFGWLIIIILQTGIGVGLFLFRNQLLKAFSGMRKGIASPRYAMNRFRMGGDPYRASRVLSQKRKAVAASKGNINRVSGKNLQIEKTSAEERSVPPRMETPDVQTNKIRIHRERRYRAGKSEPVIVSSRIAKNSDAAGTKEVNNIIRPGAGRFRSGMNIGTAAEKEVKKDKFVPRPTLDSTRLGQGKAENVNAHQILHEAKGHRANDRMQIAGGNNSEIKRAAGHRNEMNIRAAVGKEVREDKFVPRPTLDSTRLKQGKTENVNVNQIVHEAKGHRKNDSIQVPGGNNKIDSEIKRTAGHRTEKLYLESTTKRTETPGGNINRQALKSNQSGNHVENMKKGYISLHDENANLSKSINNRRDGIENIKVDHQNIRVNTQNARGETENIKVHNKEIKQKNAKANIKTAKQKNMKTRHKNISASPEVLKKNYRNGNIGRRGAGI